RTQHLLHLQLGGIDDTLQAMGVGLKTGSYSDDLILKLAAVARFVPVEERKHNRQHHQSLNCKGSRRSPAAKEDRARVGKKLGILINDVLLAQERNEPRLLLPLLLKLLYRRQLPLLKYLFVLEMLDFHQISLSLTHPE